MHFTSLWVSRTSVENRDKCKNKDHIGKKVVSLSVCVGMTLSLKFISARLLVRYFVRSQLVFQNKMYSCFGETRHFIQIKQ